MAKRLKRKIVAKAKRPVLSKTMEEAFLHFLEHHPIKRVSKNLRRILMEHLMQNEAGQSIYLYETLMDLHGLFELLDVAEDDTNR
jgi:Mor family transcriptional regulator